MTPPFGRKCSTSCGRLSGFCNGWHLRCSLIKTLIWTNSEAKSQRDLARKVILNPESPWRSHGLGMIQYELSEQLRIHIWDPRLCMFPLEETGHCHRFDMVSSVLWGEVNHIEVTPVPGTGYKRVLFGGDAKTHVQHTEDLCDLIPHPMRIVAGQTYSMPHTAAHQFFISGLAITLIERHNLQGISEAFFPVGTEPRPGRASDGFGVDKEISLSVIEDARRMIQDA